MIHGKRFVVVWSAFDAADAAERIASDRAAGAPDHLPLVDDARVAATAHVADRRGRVSAEVLTPCPS